MKKLMIAVALVAGAICTSCNTGRPKYIVDMAIIIDATDTATTYPNAADIIAPLGLSANPWMGCRIACTYVSDREVNDTKIVTIDPENEWSGNILLRKKKIGWFIAELQGTLIAMKPHGTMPRSIIFRTVARQCDQLALSNAPKKYCIVVSDLRENSTDMNFYNAQTIALLRNNPSAIQRRLEQSVPLSSLPNMEVWLLYNPPNYDANNTYMLIAAFYQHLFAMHGAEVHLATKFQP